jgi:magnesium chelatase subunit ChlD-like protein
MAYLQRSRIAILEFAGQGARLSVPPQRTPKQHADMIDTIAGGGGTPLRQGLEKAIQLLERERKRLPQEQQTLVLFTDGRSRDAIDDLRVPCRTLVIDTESGPLRLGRCRQLANTMNGEYLSLDNLPVKRYDA